MKVGFITKNRQIDLDNNEEDLPELSNELNLEQRMEEFHSISLPFKASSNT